MYENAFNGIERDLRAEEGISNELETERIATLLRSQGPRANHAEYRS